MYSDPVVPRFRARLLRFLKLFLVASVILVALALAALWWSGWLDYFNDPFNDRSFDRDAWLQLRDSDDPDNPRGRMVESLVGTLEKSRPTRHEVIRLLGPSEYDCAVLLPPAGPRETCLSYNLGMWSGMRMDYDSLDVYFGVNGRVSEVLTVQH